MKKRNKKYNTENRFNPVIQAKKIDSAQQSLKLLGEAIKALSKSHDNHISYLGNFAKHDVKNAILNMDSLLATTSASEFTIEKIDSLSLYLTTIRETLDNFAKLVPYTSTGTFQLKDLFLAIELLSRNEIVTKKIKLSLDYNKNDRTEINLPFQAIFQIVNNLMINAYKILEDVESPQIEVRGALLDKKFVLEISDNGPKVIKQHEPKIFEYGFSTTGGTGIGLFHAKFMCEQFKGDICILSHSNPDYTKMFKITLPF